MIEELKRYLKGWKAYFGFAEVQSPSGNWTKMDRPAVALLPLEAMGTAALP
jgi:hypothetical protein